MIDELDEVTPQDLYFGRMVRELLRGGGIITIQNHGLGTDAVRISYDTGDWSKRSNTAKAVPEIEMAKSALSMAEYEAEEMLRYHALKEQKQ